MLHGNLYTNEEIYNYLKHKQYINNRQYILNSNFLFVIMHHQAKPNNFNRPILETTCY